MNKKTMVKCLFFCIIYIYTVQQLTKINIIEKDEITELAKARIAAAAKSGSLG